MDFLYVFGQLFRLRPKPYTQEQCSGECRHYPPCGFKHAQENTQESYECQTYAQGGWLE